MNEEQKTWMGLPEKPIEEVLFPKHKCGLYLSHNEPKDVYETVKQNIEDGRYRPENFVSKEDMQKCIDSDDIWELQWYPDTPIGSYIILGSNLKIVLEKALEISNEEN